MNRLTKLDESTKLYDIKGLDYTTMHKLLSEEEHAIYCNAITKLAEYEDTGLEPQNIITVQELSKKYFDTGVKLMLENEYINKELEVYKRALQIADLETEGMKEYLLEKARKEFENDSD